MKNRKTISENRRLGAQIGEMRFLDFLLPREQIGGIEITESSLRFVFFKKRRREVIAFEEASLRPGLISNGIPQDIDTLAYFITIALDRLGKGKKLARKFIVSVPDSVIYSHPFFIPLGLNEEEEISFVKNNFHSICPFPFNDFYVDWQSVFVFENKKIILVTAGLRSAIDAYRNALSIAGVEQVALEPFSISLQRMLEIPNGCNILFCLLKGKFTTLISVDKNPYFIRESPLQGENASFEEVIGKELRRLQEFVGSTLKEKQISFSYLPLEPIDEDAFVGAMKERGIDMWRTKVKELKSKDTSFTLFPHFLGVAGSTQRGLIPRAKDTIVSILPVGTEIAYVQMKRRVFLATLRNIMMGVAGLIFLAFAGLYAFLFTITEQEVNRVILQNQTVIPAQASAIQTTVEAFNTEVERLLGIQEMIISPSPSLDAIESIRFLGGIQISSLSVVQESGSSKMTIRGVAGTRENFRVLGEYLERPEFSEVDFPIFSIVESVDISFTIHFTYVGSR
jgi:hypothetical protein